MRKEDGNGKRAPRRLVQEARKALKKVWQRMIREQSRIAAARKRRTRGGRPGKFRE